MADTPEKDDRTEEPTQRRLDQAIERGDVAKSQEINTFFVLGGFALAILVLSGPVARTLALDLRGFLMNAHLVPSDGAGLTAVSRGALMAWAAAVAMPPRGADAGGLAGGAIQHRPLWSGEPLRPQLSRLSPLSGVQAGFRPRSRRPVSEGPAQDRDRGLGRRRRAVVGTRPPRCIRPA